jgi:uncharacterized protein (TIGR02569 family)
MIMAKIIPDSIVEAFDGKGTPELLQGGQGETYRIGNIVIKRCWDAVETEGLSDIMNTVIQQGFRRARPIKSTSGYWIIDNWQAFEFIEGKLGIAGREKEALSGCHALNGALRKAYPSNDCPPWLKHRTNFWHVCNRIAWGEQKPSAVMTSSSVSEIQPLFDRLQNISELKSQIVHGDPGGGNVLFQKNEPPGMIDISPYWRPAGYSIAMLLADAVAWEGSKPEVLELGKNELHFQQLLLRAVLFRLSIPALRSDVQGIHSSRIGYEPILNYIGVE